MWVARLALACLVGLCALAQTGCAQPPAGPEDVSFGDPRPVTLRGYDGDAMEPFITRDDRYLLFNNRNEPADRCDLHWAERIDDVTFAYRGLLTGANSGALDAVPSLDREGSLYFVSTRSYAQSLATIYRGRFDAGQVTGVDLVPGLSLGRLGQVMFDAEIAPDGQTLVAVDGQFSGGAVPSSARLVLARREGERFVRQAESDRLLKPINDLGMVYAPSVSADLLELFFTRLDGTTLTASATIWRSTRPAADQPFGPPARLSALSGFVEAPSLSGDGRRLYYHQREPGGFRLKMITRR